MSKKANNTGTIREKTVTRDGKEYHYWEARITVGYDSVTGKQTQRSITGKTQKEVIDKMKPLQLDVDEGEYIEPQKMTLKQWFDTWQEVYLIGVKPLTAAKYADLIRLHINPTLGNYALQSIRPENVQKLYNNLTIKNKLSGKTVKDVHCVLNQALKQAVRNKLIKSNPAADSILPKTVKKEIKPLDDEGIQDFITAMRGDKFENIYLTTMFTGMREGEVLGLTWDCVDFKQGTILINKQLQRMRDGSGYVLSTTKSGKARTIVAPNFVMGVLKQQQRQQLENRFKSQGLWENEKNLVFTNELGGHLCIHTVYKSFKRIAAKAGRPETRFHDLRHSYAVAALRAGDDIKTLQSNLGHATASFTLDVYAHCTDQMKRDSANRMDRFITQIEA